MQFVTTINWELIQFVGCSLLHEYVVFQSLTCGKSDSADRLIE
ncbi:hypothetical protein [Bacillus sp. WMMC1349]|nr:hypothetical protein [Bacillus sp. WMMC1349]